MACHPLTRTEAIFVSVNIVPAGIALQLRASVDMGKSMDMSMNFTHTSHVVFLASAHDPCILT